MPRPSKDTTYTKCSEPSCEAKVANHQWGRIKAEGWFFSRDGKVVYCPEHIPQGIREWRERKKQPKV